MPGSKRPTAATSQPGTSPTSADLSWLPVRDGEEPWTQAELDAVHEELLGEQDRLRQDLAESEEDLAGLMRDFGDGSGDDSADTGGKVLEREQELTLTQNSRTLLAQTERALVRLADHTYGACESCGGAIGKARALAFPRATLCVSCKQKQERR